MSESSVDRVKHFELNTTGRDFVVGDIHGCFTELQTELDKVHFDECVDRLFSVGDLIDRGLESRRSTEWLDKPWFHAVRGNHEEMLIHYSLKNVSVESLLSVGGQWATELSIDELNDYVVAFTQLPIAIDVQTHCGLVGIVHADCPTTSWNKFIARLPLAFGHELSKMKGFAQWSRDRLDHGWTTRISDVTKVIVGHNTVKEPLMLGNVHYIDTGAGFADGHLTLIELA
jgi:serine/threonine protein phosphatase 1